MKLRLAVTTKSKAMKHDIFGNSICSSIERVRCYRFDFKGGDNKQLTVDIEPLLLTVPWKENKKLVLEAINHLKTLIHKKFTKADIENQHDMECSIYGCHTKMVTLKE